MKTRTIASVGLCLLGLLATVAGGDAFRSTVSGGAGALPAGYAPPLVSNGSLCLQVDTRGGQAQQAYCNMTPGIWWAGRRYGPPKDELVPFGHFASEISVGGKVLTAPASWAQTLDTKEAVVYCRNEHAEGMSVETSVFVPLAHDLIVVKKRVSATGAESRNVRLTFRYQFTPPGTENRMPRRMTCTSGWSEASRSADFRFEVDGHRPGRGIVSVFADKPVAAAVDRQAVALSADVTVDSAKPAEVTFYLLLADSLDGKDYPERAARLREQVHRDGFDGLLTAHRQEWGRYWDESYVRVPDERMQTIYCTAQYHLRANATKWSFPVGIFPRHWGGRFFAWDEMFCYQALVSSNHRDIARRCPEFRLAGLKIALDRSGHYGRPGTYGARYPWETLEDGSEGAMPGYWIDHVFHMSNIAQSAWFHYLYTSDAAYLKKTGYPLVKECARFFVAHMVYESADGGLFIGKCTDLERLGPAKLNPFMTSCGAIYTLEAAARGAALLKEDEQEAANWRRVAAKLRESLPWEGGRYVPYTGCKDESIASMGGLFPYPLFDETSELQRNAAYHYLKNGRAFGNMYHMGNSVCAWYLGWMAAALAGLGDKTEPARLLGEAAGGAGLFGELFEINEPKVSLRPWFSTAAGNVVYALNQMLVQCRGEEIRVAAGAPEAWKEYGFKLACHGDLVIEAEVKGGKLTRLGLIPGDGTTEHRRTLVVPAGLIDEGTLNRAVVAVGQQGGNKRIEVRFRGRTEIVQAK